MVSFLFNGAMILLFSINTKYRNIFFRWHKMQVMLYFQNIWTFYVLKLFQFFFSL